MDLDYLTPARQIAHRTHLPPFVFQRHSLGNYHYTDNTTPSSSRHFAVGTAHPITLTLCPHVELSMAKLVGGYLLPMDDAKNLARSLGIDVDNDPDHMEWPFNNWLADNRPEMKFKAAVISWPRSPHEIQEDAVIFASNWKWKEGRNDSLVEREEDLGIKACLAKMGARMQSLKWVFVEDNCSITLGGLKAMKSDMKFRKVKSLDQLLEIDEAVRATRLSRRSGN